MTASGNLTYTPAANANGGDGDGDDHGRRWHGQRWRRHLDARQTFTITVTPVNDAPSFTKGADQTVLEDAGRADGDRLGDGHLAGAMPTRVGQTVDLHRHATTTTRLVHGASRRSTPNGTLTYTPAANANGTATVTVAIKDNGGTANGGVDTSAPQTS